MKEATARIKINKLLEAAGWRFFDEDGRPANIRLEATTTINLSADFQTVVYIDRCHHAAAGERQEAKWTAPATSSERRLVPRGQRE